VGFFSPNYNTNNVNFFVAITVEYKPSSKPAVCSYQEFALMKVNFVIINQINFNHRTTESVVAKALV